MFNIALNSSGVNCLPSFISIWAYSTYIKNGYTFISPFWPTYVHALCKKSSIYGELSFISWFVKQSGNYSIIEFISNGSSFIKLSNVSFSSGLGSNG